MDENRNLLHHIADWWQTRQTLPRSGGRWERWLPTPGNILFSLLLVGLLIATQQVWATPSQGTNVPGPSATTINYQGRLANPDGSSVTDGNYGMSFAIWDAESRGDIMWGPESYAAVPVSGGLFNVGLGSQTSGGIPTTTWNGDRYLEITVGGETLSPRELIRSVPIAGMALTVPDGAITRAKLEPGSMGGWTFLDDNIDLVDLTGVTNSGDPPWNTIDISQHIPADAGAVMLTVSTVFDGANSQIQLRPVGSIGGGGQFFTQSWQANLWDSAFGVIKLNEAQEFQWRTDANGNTVTNGSIQLWGYYVSPP